MATKPEPELECLDYYPDADDAWDADECRGPVEFRMSLGPTGVSYPRCDHHWELRLLHQEEINRRYPTLPPSDFDPADAGESWDDPT